jgi:hypothetical protein
LNALKLAFRLLTRACIKLLQLNRLAGFDVVFSPALRFFIDGVSGVLTDEVRIASRAAKIRSEPVAPSGVKRAAKAAAVPASMKATPVAAPVGTAGPHPKLAEMIRGAELSGADPIAVHVPEVRDAMRA